MGQYPRCDEYVSEDGNHSKSASTMIGFIGSASRVPKYAAPPTKPSKAQGIMAA